VFVIKTKVDKKKIWTILQMLFGPDIYDRSELFDTKNNHAADTHIITKSGT
jgi:hypothetical protein